ncbi:hypothetical protein PSAB6_220037 [Paraburkholderia sabiae]|nr:hypothetical protein PSAB6_220037 [Paraburkholderia sabiae]
MADAARSQRAGDMPGVSFDSGRVTVESERLQRVADHFAQRIGIADADPVAFDEGLQRHRLVIRVFGARTNTHDRRAPQFHRGDARPRGRIQRDGQIEIAREQRVQQFLRVARLDAQRHTRIRGAKRFDGRRNQAQTETRQTADAQMPFRLQRQIAREIADAVEVRLKLLRFGEQQLGFARRLKTAVHAVEERQARAALRVGEHLADGRLRNAQQLGRFRQRAGAHDGVKDFDVAQAHDADPRAAERWKGLKDTGFRRASCLSNPRNFESRHARMVSFAFDVHQESLTATSETKSGRSNAS